jgi:glutamine synthetase
MFRSPANNRFEDRSISGMANPYLAAAVYIAAGLDGIKNKIDPGEPNIGVNVWDMPFKERRKKGLTPLPQNLGDACDALEKDKVIMAGLGDIGPEYLRLKRAEWSEFMSHVTRWETKRYLTLV